MQSIFDVGLEACSANYVPLSPVSFLQRTATIFPEHVAIRYGKDSHTYAELYDRCCRLMTFLQNVGVARNVAVSVLLPNVPAMVELHFAVPAVGGVLHPINTRLDAEAIKFQIEHCESEILIYDREYAELVSKVLATTSHALTAIEVVDSQHPFPFMDLGQRDYEDIIRSHKPSARLLGPESEWDAIAVSYTSGTTGNPKGVVTHHRGAYLNATANALAWSLPQHPVYLWTLPMFHCNGWCFPWTITHLAGTHVCLRRIDSAEIQELIANWKVTHFCAAPIVLTILANDAAHASPFPQAVNVLTAGSPPSATTIAAMEALNANVTQVYGLTETYASTVVSAWKPSWDALDKLERYQLKARAGVQYPACEQLEVIAEGTAQPVPWDGITMGEVVVRGNTVMKGYLKNHRATDEAFEGGWFHTGDLAVRDPDGYISIKDRSKDIIISGGENISSMEVEEVLYAHPAVLEAAVVAMLDQKWGEVPCAFVNLKPGYNLSEQDLIEHCKIGLAKFKVPKKVFFGPIERTATGKVQKFRLRQQANTKDLVA